MTPASDTIIPHHVYRDECVTIYVGDWIQLCSQLPDFDTVYIDLNRIRDDQAAEVSRMLPKHDTLIVHADSNDCPSLAVQLAGNLKGIQVCWLERKSLTGKSDVAYAFGKRRHVNPAYKFFEVKSDRELGDPRPKRDPLDRPLQHVLGLFGWFAGELILDPFLGNGTALLAAKLQNRRAVGIARDSLSAHAAIERLQQQVMPIQERQSQLI